MGTTNPYTDPHSNPQNNGYYEVYITANGTKGWVTVVVVVAVVVGGGGIGRREEEGGRDESNDIYSISFNNDSSP